MPLSFEKATGFRISVILRLKVFKMQHPEDMKQQGG